MFTTDTHIDLTARRFIDRTLPKPDWTHEAHFAVALYLLKREGVAAFGIMPGLIRAYNEATGVENSDTEGYHDTITRASLMAADHCAKAHPEGTALHLVLADLMRSKYGRSGWLLEHWTKACLFSVAARRSWVAPDLKPLAFEQDADGSAIA
ncbi:MAG: hypothetical protein AAF269_05155 [Pseudomonadota bacterium]